MNRGQVQIRKRAWILAALVLTAFGLADGAQAQGLTAQAAVESDSVFAGQPFRFQIQVSGSDSPSEPDVSGLTDFQVGFLGGGANSSSSMTVINGRVSREIRRGYIFNYELTAKRAGTLVIPSIVVRDGSAQAQTQPVQITASQPEEVDDFRLRVELSKTEAFVGEPLIFNLTFYYKAEVADPKLTLPMLNTPGFRFYDQESPAAEDGVLFEGQRFRTMRLRKAVIPEQAGDYQFPPATLSVQGMVGFRTMQDMFFGPSRRREFQRFVVPSNELSLRVLELPAAGRPANFAGHVGSFSLDVKASPLSVNVGDPITLTLIISGPPFLDQVAMPPLQTQEALVRDFRLPSEVSAGKVDGRIVTFTQTIRAQRADVGEIPAIELPYFDPEARAYRVARSPAIPLEVKATRVVTAGDAEGLDPVTRQTSEIQESRGGIAYNYEDLGALRDQGFEIGAWLRSGTFLGLLLLPPGAYAGLWFLLRRRRLRAADPEGVRERRAYAVFSQAIGEAGSADGVLDALRGYLRDKLRLGAGALTFRDVEPALRARSVESGVVEDVRRVFDACEQSRYAGLSAGDVAELAGKSRSIVERIESVRRRPTGLALARALVFVVAVLPGSIQGALAPGEAEAVFREGNELFRQANEAATRDSQAAAGLYGKAILRFERLIREGGIENGKLYYNIGNAYFRMNDLGRAILNYRRAQELIPHDANLVRNLAYARQLCTDKIEVSGRRRVAAIFLFWHYDLTARMKVVLLGWGAVLAWVSLGAGLFRPVPYLRWTAAGCGVVAGLMLVSLLVEARARESAVPGVVVAEEVVARKGDGLAYEPSFQEPLHAGAELTLVEERPGWRLVELEDGRRCWLPEKTVELVR